jgi:hypothetical protein
MTMALTDSPSSSSQASRSRTDTVYPPTPASPSISVASNTSPQTPNPLISGQYQQSPSSPSPLITLGSRQRLLKQVAIIIYIKFHIISYFFYIENLVGKY